MADLAQLEAALVKADAAGDAEGARVLAGAVREARASAAPQQTAPQQAGMPDTMLGKVGGAVANTAGTLASGALAAPISGLGGIAGAALPGPEGQGADWTRRIQNALTLSPQAPGSATLTDVVTKPLQWLSHGADVAGGAVTDKFGPTAGAAVNTAINMAPAALGLLGGSRLRGAVEKTAERRDVVKSQNAPADALLAEARDAGYLTQPDSILGGLAGKAATKQEIIQRHQEVTDRLARKVAGLDEKQPITEGTLNKRLSEEAAPYREVEALSSEHPLFQPPFKNPAQSLKELQEARFNANSWHQYANRTGNPVARKRADKFDDKAEALESSIEQAAGALGKPDLVQQLRDARIKMAQIYELKKALNVDGTIDAQTIGRLYDKNPGRYTGELATIGKFAATYPQLVRTASQSPHPGGGALNPIAAAGLGMEGHATGLGWWPAGVAMVGGPTRSLLLSSAYQQPRSYGPGLMEMIGRGASNEGTPLGLGAGQAGTATLEDIIRRAAMQNR